MSKPTLILVHGSWHRPEHFGPLTKALEGHGYKCVPVTLPSTQSPDMPPAKMSDDTEAIRNTVIQELDQGNNVVVVAHSYGGTPTNNSLKGLDKESRTAAGASTAVIAIAFIAAICLPAGITFLTGIGGKPSEIHDRRTEDFSWVGEPGPGHYFYNDLSDEESKKWSDLLQQQSWPAYLEETTYAAYMDIPSNYLFCTKDNAFLYPYQQGMIAGAKEAGAKFDHTETVDSSHSPFLSMAERTSDFVRRAAGEDVALKE